MTENENKIKIEVAVFTPEAAFQAEQAGADRIELCSGFTEGGLSPSAGTCKLVAKVMIPVHVMIRPRIGDFVYTATEAEAIRYDIEHCFGLGLDGIVIGALNTDATINKHLTRLFVDWAFPMSVTFHRAFDLCPNQEQALEDLIECRVTRVLTSGGQPTALLGGTKVKRLVEQAGNRITVMAGGGITAENAPELIELTKVREIHLSAKKLTFSTMHSINQPLSITSSERVSDSCWFDCDQQTISKIRKLI